MVQPRCKCREGVRSSILRTQMPSLDGAAEASKDQRRKISVSLLRARASRRDASHQISTTTQRMVPPHSAPVSPALFHRSSQDHIINIIHTSIGRNVLDSTARFPPLSTDAKTLRPTSTDPSGTSHHQRKVPNHLIIAKFILTAYRLLIPTTLSIHLLAPLYSRLLSHGLKR